MDTLFFLLSRTLGIALLAETWLALALLGTTIAAMRGKARAAAWSASLSLVLLLCLGTLPLGEALIKPLEREFPPRAAPAEIDGIIILGGVEDQRLPHGPAARELRSGGLAAGRPLPGGLPQCRADGCHRLGPWRQA